MVRKAAIGSGHSPGVAIDLARATVWLCAHGFDGVGCALLGLEGEPRSTLCEGPTGGWKAPSARCVLDARAGIDLIACGAAQAGVTFTAGDAPLLILGTAAVASREQQCAFELVWDGRGRCVVDRGAARGAVATSPDSVTVGVASPATAADAPAIEPVAEIEVDPKTWQRASALAARTYVPSTAASRAAGAGAGLTDND